MKQMSEQFFYGNSANDFILDNVAVTVDSIILGVRLFDNINNIIECVVCGEIGVLWKFYITNGILDKFFLNNYKFVVCKSKPHSVKFGYVKFCCCFF